MRAFLDGCCAAVKSWRNIHPGISRELDVPWKAKHGTPSGSPNPATPSEPPPGSSTTIRSVSL
jgi:hypothetical protein